MAGREEYSVGELTITRGIKAGIGEKLAKVIRGYKCVPAAKVANRYFTGNMANGAYAILNSGLPGDGLAHNITVAATTDTGADTPGSIAFTGLDIDGKVITETIIPAQGSTVQGTKAFKQVTSMIQSGWSIVGGNDTIVIGFGDLQGLPERVAAAADILLAAFDAAIVNAPTVTVSALVLASNTITAVGDATKQLKVIYQI